MSWNPSNTDRVFAWHPLRSPFQSVQSHKPVRWRSNEEIGQRSTGCLAYSRSVLPLANDELRLAGFRQGEVRPVDKMSS